MADKDDLYKQNLHDLLAVCVVLGQVLQELDIPEEDRERVQERIDYCTKNLKTVTEKQLLLNKQKP